MAGSKIIVLLAHLKIFMSTGIGYVSDLKYPFLFAVGLKVYLPAASNFFLLFLASLMILLLVFIGWFDLKFIHLAQTTAEISTRKYNPYFTQLENRFK